MITSVKNEQILELKKLKQQKDVLVLDNPKLTKEAIKEGYEVLCVLKTEDIKESYNNEIVVSDNVLKVFSNTITSQGIVAFIKFKHQLLRPPEGDFLILDNVQDPGNVGTLIRSAAGSNFKDVYLINCASVVNDKTVRSTMGAIFKCNVFELTYEDVNKIKSWNKNIYVADMNGENVFTCEFPKNVGVIIGNEGHGVSKYLREIATNTVKIPMQNNLESLNAAVSGSIIMYQISNGGKNVRS